MSEKDLKSEFEYVDKNKEILLKSYRNKYILVHQNNVVSSFDTYEAAAQEGIRLFGATAKFLIQFLTEKEPLNFIMEATI